MHKQPIPDKTHCPEPITIPKHAVTQTIAAVVIPWSFPLFCIIIPAPMFKFRSKFDDNKTTEIKSDEELAKIKQEYLRHLAGED